MGYRTTQFKMAWQQTNAFSFWKSLPSIGIAVCTAWVPGRLGLNPFIWILCVTLLVYSIAFLLDWLHKMFWVAPALAYSDLLSRNERLENQISELTAPKLEILFAAHYPYVDERSPEPGSGHEPYKLFRVGIRCIGLKTVTDLKVCISDLTPRPAELFTPLRLRAMHDTPDRKTTEVHPGEPACFDIVAQWYDGSIHIAHVQPNVGNVIMPGRYELTINASGRDVPNATGRFVLRTPTPRQGNQDLEFALAD